jgi:hypothetical protein
MLNLGDNNTHSLHSCGDVISIKLDMMVKLGNPRCITCINLQKKLFSTKQLDKQWGKF